MKNIKYLWLVAILLTATSCKKFLKENPHSVITEDQFYKTQNDAIYAVNAVYFLLNSGGTSYQTPYNVLFSTGMDMASDDVDPGPGATNPDVRSLSVLGHSSANLRVYEIWQQHYAAIKKANVALAKIPAIDFDPTLKARLLAEAKFLRALYYFNLVRLYGDVPLVTTYDGNAVTAQDFSVAKSSSTDVYNQIQQDLTDAAAVLPNSYGSPDVGRATKGAALALLAKVYLTKASFPLRLTAHYTDAVNTALLAITSGDVPGASGSFGYALQANYANVFLPAQKNNSEHIFSAQFKSNSQGQGNNQNPRSIYTMPPAAGITGSYAEMVRFYTEGADNYYSIYKMYQVADKRKKVSFVTKYVGPKNGVTYSLKIVNPAFPNDSTPFFNKWWDPNSTSVTSESAANVPIIRYSELLLIHAEAANEVGDPTAYDSYNKVRARAGLPTFVAGSLSQAQFRDSLYKDRRLELVFEYQRWFDLIRQRDAAGNPSFVANLHKVGKTNAQDYHRLYPIPLSELSVNSKITQNPGW
ncbi:MAG TPA: RagB/SusD family nutrient uptake outer membrane protein [Cytophagaceae bacterium]|nr:RagB/SusD family nutrient uptake outer membrane protein [Cytophagaceae bacterium]